jgi:hypothetical protein
MDFGNLISIIDTASLATTAFIKGNELLQRGVEMEADGSELKLIYQQIMIINDEACAALAFERSEAEKLLSAMT